MLTGQQRNKAHVVSFSNKKSRKWQQVNIRNKFLYWPEGERLVKLRISARSIRTIEKKGLSVMAKEAGLNLWKLPFNDARPMRLEFLRTKSPDVPRPKSRQNNMKNPDRLAASRKKPIVPRYIGGRIFWIRDGADKDIYELIQSRMKADSESKTTSSASQNNNQEEVEAV
jgi:large subunit ribosomal protein L28